MNIKLKKDSIVFIPERAHSTDAGLDIKSPVRVNIKPYSAEMIDTNISVEIPHGYFGAIRNRSSMFACGIITDGTIDEGYTGTVKIVLRNLTQFDMHIEIGDKIAQLVIIPCSYEDVTVVDSLKTSERGIGGFGSTGR